MHNARTLTVATVVATLTLTACRFETSRTLGAGDLRGRIVVADDAGLVTPVDGAIVQLEGSGFTVRSDARGRFALRGVPSGSWSVRVRKQGASGELGLRLRNLDLSTLGNSANGRDLGDVRIGGLGAWDARLLRGTDGVAGGSIYLAGEREAVSGADGAFKFERLLPGTYDVAVTDPSRPGLAVLAPIEVPLGGTVDTDVALDALTLVETGDVTGVALLSGATSHDGIQISLPGAGAGELFTNADGFFQAPGLRAGIYTLVAEAQGFRTLQVPFVVVAGETELPAIALLPDSADCANGGLPFDENDVDADGIDDAEEDPRCLCAPGGVVGEDGLCFDDEAPLPSCDDDVRNGDETGVDCGGSCDPCATCSDDIQNGDETGVDCGGTCAPCDTCNDDIQNGDETGVDCGGSCAPCESCSDDVQNGDETGVDCGGSCAPCPTCDDEEQNGDETGLDCGGSCDPCPVDPFLCTDDGPCIVFPLSTANVPITSVTAVPGTDKTFAIGAGRVLRRSGLAWEPEFTAPFGRLDAVYAHSPTFAVAAGPDGTWTWDGTTWSEHGAVTGSDVLAVAGDGPDNLFFSTNGGLRRWSGGPSLVLDPIQPAEPPSRLGYGGGVFWAASAAELLVDTGSGFSVVESFDTYFTLTAMQAGQTGSVVYAVLVAGPGGGSATSVYTRMATGGPFEVEGSMDAGVIVDLSRRPTGVAEGPIYALLQVAGAARVVRHNGLEWESYGPIFPLGSDNTAARFAQYTHGEFMVVDEAGAMSRVTAAGVESAEGLDPVRVRRLTGTTSNDVFLLEESGGVRHRDATGWSRLPAPPAHVIDLVAVGSGTAWALHADWSLSSWTGTAWERTESLRPEAPIEPGLCLSFGDDAPLALHALGPSTLLLGGTMQVDGGQGCEDLPVAVLYGAGEPTTIEFPLAGNRAIVGFAGDASNTWVFGDAGGTCRLNGDTPGDCAASNDLATESGIRDAWAGAFEPWAIDAFGRLRRFSSGTSWPSLSASLPVDSFLTALHGVPAGSNDDVVAVGSSGLVVTASSAVAPATLPRPVLSDLTDVWGPSSGLFWTGGAGLFKRDAGSWTRDIGGLDSVRAGRIASAAIGRPVATTAGGQLLARVDGSWVGALGLRPNATYDIAAAGETTWVLDTSMGALASFDGAAFTPLAEPFGQSGRDRIVGIIEGQPVVRGFMGIERWTGSNWEPLTCGAYSAYDFREAAFLPDGTGYMAGSGSAACRRNADGSLTDITIPDNLDGVRLVATAPGGVGYVLDTNNVLHRHSIGGGWTSISMTGTTFEGQVRALHVTQEETVFLAIDGGGGEGPRTPAALFRLRQNADWERVELPLGTGLVDLAGSGNEVWGVNTDGAILLVESRTTET